MHLVVLLGGHEQVRVAFRPRQVRRPCIGGNQEGAPVGDRPDDGIHDVGENRADDEIDAIKKHLPNGVKIAKVEEKLSALGNCVACNDKVALIHPELDKDTEDVIAEILDVEVYRTTIAGNPLVGTYAVLTNNGGLTHPMCGVAELDELSTLL